MSHSTRLTKMIEVTGSIATIFAAGYLVWTLASRPAAPSAPPPAVEAVADAELPAALTTKTRGRGQLAIVEFADFECPFCGRHAKDVLPILQTEFVDTGLVTYIFMNYPLEQAHPHALKASEAAECALREGKYWEMHERLFKTPTKLTADDLLEHGTAVGLNAQSFSRCLDGAAAADVKADIEAGNRLGVNATPSFFLGRIQPNGSVRLTRRLNGAASIDVFRAEVRKLADDLRLSNTGDSGAGRLARGIS